MQFSSGAALVEFMYLEFTRMPGKRRRRLRSLLCLCDVFRALIKSLVCSPKWGRAVGGGGGGGIKNPADFP